MPELPEVETIRRDLAGCLAGRRVAGVEVLDPSALEGIGPDGGPRRRIGPGDFDAAVRGETVAGVRRRGKYLIFEFASGRAFLVHLRMTGRLLWGAPAPASRVRIRFDETAEVLSFCDTRRFGELWTAGDWRQDPAIRALGPEPLEELDVKAWGRGLRRSAARVHAALLDQRRLAGIGNIYATEALFRAGLRPTLRGRRIPAGRVPVLLREIREVLRDGVENRGVSFRDYRDASGRRGRARERLLVYGKEGRPCPRCRSVLKGARVNGRGTVYCPRCQR